MSSHFLLFIIFCGMLLVLALVAWLDSELRTNRPHKAGTRVRRHVEEMGSEEPRRKHRSNSLRRRRRAP